jgi:hypothetical protein
MTSRLLTPNRAMGAAACALAAIAVANPVGDGAPPADAPQQPAPVVASR